ncbi:MAG TPA: protein kinase [Blastocatellia bacterium]|nr:protein kinase [Blastocatellia bacterium]
METRKLAADAVLQDRYRILSLLNQGGMGRVYLAEDMRFRSRVAVKEAYLTNEEFRRAFAREAGLLHRLRHRALPHVTDHFAEGEAQYLVMQLFPGKDLDELLNEKIQETGEAFAVNQVLRWADQLLDALEYLHGHQPPVVHRDIKPQNLKLTEQGDVILLDFGLAKGAAAETSQTDEAPDESLHGFTRHYAPLEQIRGAGTDPRSDLYALAATVYRLITGRVPSDALTRATAALERRPDPLRPANKLNEQVTEAVAAVLTRALAQLPDERPANATEMRQALRAAVQPKAAEYYDTAASIDGPRMAIPHLSEESATSALGATKSPASEVTNAGRIVSPSPAPGVDDQGAAFAWSRLGGARTVYVALCLLLSVIAALAYWRLNPLSGSGAANPAVGETAIARPDGSTPAPTPFEAMRYYLEVETETGSSERVADDNPVVRGRFLKFHFTPSRRGYLYIIAPGELGGRATFLTARPNSAWRVKDNLLKAGTDYSFPPRQNKWIEVAHDASIRTYTVIFAPEPLVHLRFLAGPPGRALTVAEEGELDELQKRYGQGVRVEEQDAQSIVSIPAERVSGEPFLFEINFRLGADKKGGQR